MFSGCSCKTGCNSKRCSCVKGSKGCTSACKCPSDQCVNKGQEKLDSSSEGQDERSVLCDKTNNLSSGMSLRQTFIIFFNKVWCIKKYQNSDIWWKFYLTKSESSYKIRQLFTK